MNDFDAAMAAEREGRIADAHALYCAVAAREDRNAQALRRQGVTAFRLGRRREGLECLQRALGIEKSADLLLDFAAMLQEVDMLEAARAAYVSALRLAPDSVDGRHGCASCLHQLGRGAEAEKAYGFVIALRPDLAVAYENVARTLVMQDRPRQAAAAFRRAARLDPGAASTWNNLGMALNQIGDLGDEAAFRNALRCDGTHFGAWQNLCRLLTDRLGKDAPAALQRLAALHPGDPDVWMMTAQTLILIGKRDLAARVAERASALAPGNVVARNMLGNALTAAGNLAAAAEAYRAVLRQEPHLIEPALNLADVLLRMGRRDEMFAALRAVAASAPSHGRIWRILARALTQDLRHEEALKAFLNAALLAPGDEAALMDMGAAALRVRRFDWAEAFYARALAVSPDNVAAMGHLVELSQSACDWARLAPLERRLLERAPRDGVGAASPFGLLTLGSTAAEQLAAARRWAAAKALEAPPLAPCAVRRPSDGRVRVGYLSSDYREHAISQLAAGVLEAHDRSRVEATAYSIGPDDGGPMRRRIADGVERFVDLKDCGDGEAARRIAADGLDILIDVNGYTAFARTAIMAARPAPIRANWLGYPGTMGADFIDYVIADRHVIPPGDEKFYSEAVVRLPHCYQPNDRLRRVAAETPSRAACGLPEEGFVFCCFNSLHKINRDAFTCWLRILRATPGAVLWLLEGRAAAKANLRRAAQAGGVAPERLIFAPPLPPPQHLARHRLADLFLDTLPYNAHTTGSDALWAGLPMLTRPGDTFAGRVGMSLTVAAGLPEMAVESLEAYEATAIELARDRDRLDGLKRRLSAQRLTCPLFDTRRFARNIESAFVEMQAIRLSGGAPRAFSVEDKGAG